MKNTKDLSCSTCPFPEKICLSETGKGLENCPTLFMKDTIASALKGYDHPDTAKFARAAAQQEAECYFGRLERPFTVIAFKTRGPESRAL
jgi:hypothetical protein